MCGSSGSAVQRAATAADGAGDERGAVEVEQVAQDEQAVGERARRAVAVDVENGPERREVARDRVRGAAGAVDAQRAAGQRRAGEAEQETQDQQTVGQRPDLLIGVDVEDREGDEAPGEDALRITVLIRAVPGDDEVSFAVDVDGRVALRSHRVGCDLKLRVESATRKERSGERRPRSRNRPAAAPARTR